ncbi:MAG: molybdopterin molybdotransferase MoeA [Alphaproteobacteria bacterium]|jgi:molybdopterin molybdotransferase|nr:molybdopterin molybdotransferase MoeA [Alphaproteobacteria bacterium]MDP6564971.1 molybdopterin molybdotransferase MoeA [Alphaproteobacteria bacterium]MDP6811805.1 molybdopterin molybdotransferase MoeA [Alphaproteobacteria bacterium]
MSQLADDCFAHGEEMLTMAEALAILRQRATILAGDRIDRVPLSEAAGRILADDLAATLEVPAHDNSAVDGYALRHGDLADGEATRLTVVGRSAAGHPWSGTLDGGQAVRIFTGAVMPQGADAVVMQEDAQAEGDTVVVPPGLKPGANRRRMGEDSHQGDIVLPRGRRLKPQDLGLAASVGHARLPVYRRLRVAVFSTGDELQDPGQPLQRGAVYDANRHILGGLISGLGAEVSDLGILADRLEAVRTALAEAAGGHDLLITSGGVSVGDEDHVRTAVESLGNLHFWRLAIKPGRPLALGQVRGTAFVGLPGNPVAATVCFLRFARPLILGLAGCAELEPLHYRVAAGFSFEKKAGRREWLRARLVLDGGEPRVERFDRQGSGIINSLVQTDGLVEIPEAVTHLERGDAVDFLPFSEVVS